MHASNAFHLFRYFLIFATSAVLTSRPAFATTPSAAAGVTYMEQFGRLRIIAYPLYVSLRFIYVHVVHNWGTSIILFTVAFNALMVWPRIRSMKSSLQMMRLRPQLDSIRKRYAPLGMTDPKRAEMNREITALYAAEGVSALGGCVPLLVQTPLLFGFFSVLQNARELHNAGWAWLIDLSKPDPLHILPFVIIVMMTITQFITPTPGMNPSQRQMMAILMAVIFGFALWKYAAGIALYWATGNIINLLIQILINRSAIGRQMRELAETGSQ